MKTCRRDSAFLLIVIILLCTLFCVLPTPGQGTQDYTITYDITLHQDSSAAWAIEYRIPIQSPEDQQAFQEDANSSPILSADSIKGLMEQSAGEAAQQTGRSMDIEDFDRSSAVQSSPTGTYGVLRYTFLWTNFTAQDDTISLGDVFAGGLYLPVGASLVVGYPSGYAVASADPPPSETNGNLVWDGPYSFAPGQPAVTFTRIGVPVSYLEGIVGVIILCAGGGVFFAVRKSRRKGTSEPVPCQVEPETAVSNEADLSGIEERILGLLAEADGEMFQSAIGERLSLPKSTVSSALNALQARNLIQKVKKGRENLIRRLPKI